MVCPALWIEYSFGRLASDSEARTGGAIPSGAIPFIIEGGTEVRCRA
jgi:hypothetical protein